MTAGAGICHSEVSTAATTVLHGVQLWVALPDADRDTGRDFAHHAPEPVEVEARVLRVFLGELAGSRSPVHTFTPLLGAQIDLEPGARGWISTSTRPSSTACCWTGVISLQPAPRSTSPISRISPPAATPCRCTTRATSPLARSCSAAPPFGEELVMWWNFVGRSHDDIATYRGSGRSATPASAPSTGYAAPSTVARSPTAERHVAATAEPEGRNP